MDAKIFQKKSYGVLLYVEVECLCAYQSAQKAFNYEDFFAFFSSRFSLSDFSGFFLTSFFMSLLFAMFRSFGKVYSHKLSVQRLCLKRCSVAKRLVTLLTSVKDIIFYLLYIFKNSSKRETL